MYDMEEILNIKKLAKITNSKIAFFDGEKTMIDINSSLSGNLLDLTPVIPKRLLFNKKYPNKKGYYRLVKRTCNNKDCKIGKPDKDCKLYFKGGCGVYDCIEITDGSLVIPFQSLYQLLKFVPREFLKV